MMFLMCVVVVMFVRMVMRMIMMRMIVMVAVFVGMFMAVVRVRVIMRVREVDVKFHPGNGGFLAASNVQVIAAELELLQFPLKFGGIHAQVEQRGDEHVACDAAENVEVKGFHIIPEGRVPRGPTQFIIQGLVELVPPTRALIWLAA